jgi:hypothetical protein
MVDIGEMENFLNEKSAKSGDIVEIIGEGLIEEQETQFGKRKILNIPVKLNGIEKIWSPAKIARAEAQKIFESTNTKTWVGKKFQVIFVKMTIKGELKDVIIPGKINTGQVKL